MKLTLDTVRRNSEVEIVSIPEGDCKSQLIRMGISEGVRVTCRHKLPLGAIVLKSRRQEMAIGRQLAKQIVVRLPR